MKAIEALRDLAIRSNNIIMKGNFTGDDIHEASTVMNWCIALVEELDKLDRDKEGE